MALSRQAWWRGAFGSVVLPIAIYGFVLRPVLSHRALRDEVIELQPGQVMAFDMQFPSARVVHAELEVLSGAPVVARLMPMSSTFETATQRFHVPAFEMLSVVECERGANVQAGRWSFMVAALDTGEGPSSIRVRTWIHRPRFFQAIRQLVAVPN